MITVSFICRDFGIAVICVLLKKAPSFHTSDSWLVREDRLSAPLTGIFSEKEKRFMTVNRLDDFSMDALATHKEGEIILSGKTSLGLPDLRINRE